MPLLTPSMESADLSLSLSANAAAGEDYRHHRPELQLLDGGGAAAAAAAAADSSDEPQPQPPFSLLGCRLSLKRPRTGDSTSSSCDPQNSCRGDAAEARSSKRTDLELSCSRNACKGSAFEPEFCGGFDLEMSPSHNSSKGSHFGFNSGKRSDLEPSTSSASADMEARRAAVRSWGNLPLPEADPEIHSIMEKEKKRQLCGIELIASENFVCRAVLEALGSHLTNKYSEGYPGARYYGGNQNIDAIERICCSRALAAFGLDENKWGVNVQPYSCTSANFAVYTGLLLPKDRIMGLDSPSGGHVSHGYYTPGGKKMSGASIFFESLSYKVNPQTGYVDYERLEERAVDFHPKILICGGSSYPRDWDYARVRQIADRCGAVLMCDMAHISGLVAAKECRSPFEFCDIVTSTTHKSLRGPRGGIIFFRKGKKLRKRGSSFCQDEVDLYDFEERINFSVFPAMQGGPHNNYVAALAIALKQVASPEYRTYIQQVKKNAQALASALLRRNCKLVTGGTDNHLILWDLRSSGLTGKNFEKVCEACHISLNKTPVYGDNGLLSPGGVRIGTPAMTTRGCVEADFELMADFLLKAAQIACAILKEQGTKDFAKGLQNNSDLAELRDKVEAFASQFAMPGFD